MANEYVRISFNFFLLPLFIFGYFPCQFTHVKKYWTLCNTVIGYIQPTSHRTYVCSKKIPNRMQCMTINWVKSMWIVPRLQKKWAKCFCKQISGQINRRCVKRQRMKPIWRVFDFFFRLAHFTFDRIRFCYVCFLFSGFFPHIPNFRHFFHFISSLPSFTFCLDRFRYHAMPFNFIRFRCIPTIYGLSE